ncbi:MAG TPA: hypothetical protein VIZ28_07355 [Chitinophagaceae bacterium]
MFELNEEETLMSSSDNSVKLTTHRIIHESEKGRKQIMLEDFESYQLIRSSIGAYGYLLFIFVVITILIAVDKITNYQSFYPIVGNFNNNLFSFFLEDEGFMLLLVLLMVFHFFYLISRRYFIKVNGKYNSIEFRVTSLRNSSIRRMLSKLEEQSKLIKQMADNKKKDLMPDTSAKYD